MNTRRRLFAAVKALSLPALVLILCSTAPADIVLSVEDPGVQQSQRAGILTETFDTSLTVAGTFYTTINSPIGTYTAAAPGGAVVMEDDFGGANQTHYLSVGLAAEGATEVTLTFGADQSYFGFYFSAIDASNNVLVYKDSTLLAEINRTTLASFVTDSGYNGNPNLPGVDTGEKFAYVNVDGTSGTTFNRIVFSNPSRTGLESDNHSINAVPEPSSLVATGIGVLGLLGYRIRRRQVVQA